MAEYPDLEMGDMEQALEYAKQMYSTPEDDSGRLSSNYLFHFTPKIDAIKEIIRTGFRFSLQNEKIPYKEEFQQIFAVCFCDIKIKEAKVHRRDYGNNAMVMTKWWGVRMGVSPVVYIHENSAPVYKDYRSLQKKFDDLIERNEMRPDKAAFYTLIWTLLIDSGELKLDGLEESIRANEKVHSLIHDMEVEFNRFKAYLNESGNYAYFHKFIYSFTLRIHELLFHLKQRDALTRSYHGQVKGKLKVLYDEREWRAINFGYSPEFPRILDTQKPLSDIDESSLLLGDRYYREGAKNQGWLPPVHNLTFSDDDIVAILVQDENHIEEIWELIRSKQTLLHFDTVKDKIHPIDQFSENI